MARNPLQDWKKKDPIAASHLQEAVNAIRENRISIDQVRSLIGPRTFLEMRIGKVANAGPNGESDFTDSRYWVKFQRGTSSDGTRMDVMIDDDWTTDGGETLNTWWTVVENLAERSGTGTSGSHGLQVDQLIICFGLWTSEDPANRVYVMNQGGVGGLFPVKVQNTSGRGGSASTTADFLYTARSLAWNGISGGTVLGTNLAPAKPRPIGLMIAQAGSTGYGTGFYDGSTFVLWDAGEVEDVGICI